MSDEARMNESADSSGDGHRPDQARKAASGAASFSDPLGAPDPLEAGLSPAEDRVVAAEWSRRIPPVRARIPEVRIGKRWYSTAWLIPIAIVGVIFFIALCQQLRTYPAVQSWIASHPGTGDFQPAVTTGFPLWLRILHFLNLIFMLFIIRAGIQILADHPRLQTDAGSRPGREWLRLRGPVPADRMAQEPPERAWTAKDDAVTVPRWLGLPGLRHSIGLARWWHFSADFLWILTGIAFYALLFATGQWARLVPVNWSVFTNAVSTAIQYGSLLGAQQTCRPACRRSRECVNLNKNRFSGGGAATLRPASSRPCAQDSPIPRNAASPSSASSLPSSAARPTKRPTP